MSTRSRCRVAAVAFVLLPAVAGLAPHAGRAAGAIGPGAVIYSSVGQCTQNFVFKNTSGALYVGTAAHCVNAVGDRVRTASGQEFGSVVYRRYSGFDDFALIKIDTSWYPEVDPSMRRWGGPTGVATPSDSNRGSVVLFHGYGMVFGSSAHTRSRAGVLVFNDGTSWDAEGPIIFGDSGGPVLDRATGKALGFANHISYPIVTVGGSTTQRFLTALSAAGINVSIVTAGYTPVP